MSRKRQEGIKKNIERTVIIPDDVSKGGGKPDGVSKTSEEESEDDVE
ncbi:hypothetical protein SAMN04487765_1692 [Tenacibaculum sp. MAR_2010_89]|nr:hypothetical protein [Tenacibaculum sp. MAR_2010_89]SEE18689.1 hypothetical protein SAMN04487765_1692 [Tenacibaculum sp. MAR_2010_89]